MMLFQNYKKNLHIVCLRDRVLTYDVQQREKNLLLSSPTIMTIILMVITIGIVITSSL